MPKQLNAFDELTTELHEGEIIEAIVFGAWGWGSDPEPNQPWEPGYDEPEPPPVPFVKRGVLLTADAAKPYMVGWSFSGGYGAPHCYAVHVWTNQRVLWVTQYDGSTRLNSAPRHPVAIIPDMPGG